MALIQFCCETHNNNANANIPAIILLNYLSEEGKMFALWLIASFQLAVNGPIWPHLTKISYIHSDVALSGKLKQQINREIQQPLILKVKVVCTIQFAEPCTFTYVLFSMQHCTASFRK